MSGCKEKMADFIIAEMEEHKRDTIWAEDIDLQTKNRVIEVCQNIVESYIGRNIDHTTRFLMNKRPHISIPDGATNGDMIKAMFPNTIAYEDGEIVNVIRLDNELESNVFYTDWWNAPYSVAESSQE